MAKSCVGPLQRLRPSACGGAAGRRAARLRARRRRDPDVAVEARVGAARPQALDRIDDERQRLEIDVDALDRLRGGRFVDGRDGENRLALIERLVGQRALGAAQIRADRRR